MRIAASIITAICGIAVVVGYFLPWMSDPYYGSLSGVDLFSIQSLLVVLGGILMAGVASGVSLGLLIRRQSVVKQARGLSILGAIGGRAAAGGGIWGIVDLMSVGASAAFGLYLCSVAAVLGLIFAIVISATA